MDWSFLFLILMTSYGNQELTYKQNQLREMDACSDWKLNHKKIQE